MQQDNVMLNSGTKIRALRDKKKYSNSRVVRKTNSERKKKAIVHPPPLQVKWSVPNQIQIDELHAEDIFMIILLSARMKLFVSPLVHSLKTYDSFVLILSDKC
jgi:superfamily I DNA and RNA helicase